MKTRSSFISNSSSSSFIVQYKIWDYSESQFLNKKTKKLTKSQINLLTDFGFKQTNDNVQLIEEKGKVNRNSLGNNFGYYTLCNQDNVINFLLKNKIPFKALCHYGHEVVIYDGDDKYYIIPNWGNYCLTYGIPDNKIVCMQTKIVSLEN